VASVAAAVLKVGSTAPNKFLTTAAAGPGSSGPGSAAMLQQQQQQQRPTRLSLLSQR
jgi:hypothetical protein